MVGGTGKRGPRGDISAETILLAAEELLASHGPGALTQRRIAKQAGVSPTALYTYAADLEEIRIALGDRFLGAIDTGLLLIDDPETALATFLQHVQKLFTDNPGHAQLLAQQRIAGPNALKLNETLLTFVQVAVGHSAEAAAGITGVLTEWVYGHALIAADNGVTPGFARALGRQEMSRYPLTAAMIGQAGLGLDFRAGDEIVRALMVRALTSPPTGGRGQAQQPPAREL